MPLPDMMKPLRAGEGERPNCAPARFLPHALRPETLPGRQGKSPGHHQRDAPPWHPSLASITAHKRKDTLNARRSASRDHFGSGAKLAASLNFCRPLFRRGLLRLQILSKKGGKPNHGLPPSVALPKDAICDSGARRRVSTGRRRCREGCS